MSKKIVLISARFPPNTLGGISSAHYNLYSILKNHGTDIVSCNFADDYKPEVCEKDIYRLTTPKLIIKFLVLINKVYFKITDQGNRAYQFLDIMRNSIGSLKINIILLKLKPEIIILPDQGCPGFFIWKQKKMKFIWISHHNPMRFVNNPMIGQHSLKDAELALKVENSTLKKVDVVFCPSKYMYDTFIKTYNYNKKVVIIPNIVDIKYIDSILPINIRNKIGLDSDSIVVYIPSAGSSIKGAKFVPEIVRRIIANSKEKIGFFLSGNIDQELEYELNFIPQKGVIYKPGFLPYSENISIMKGCSFSISPTIMESFGMAILEANICSLPVVAFDTGGVSDIITNGENGFLAPFMDIEKLLYQTTKLLDKEICSKMKLSSYKFSRKHFHEDVIVKKIMDEFNNL